jgi:hypothetical protein
MPVKQVKSLVARPDVISNHIVGHIRRRSLEPVPIAFLDVKDKTDVTSIAVFDFILQWAPC